MYELRKCAKNIQNLISIFMSHEIEADYKENWETEATQCERCTSFFVLESGVGYCNEAKAEVPLDAHCDFFQSMD